MEPILHKGQLKTWNDDRGFGFIKPEEGGKDIFLHISAIKGASRRPQAGDTILYQCVAEPDGKLRAAKASIQGVPSRSSGTSSKPQTSQTARASHRSQSTSRRPKQRGFIETILVLGGTIALLFFSIDRSPRTTPSPITPVTQPPTTFAPQPDCIIKGNISISSGRKWYHVPGMEDYENTVITPSEGERWFCSEAEAIANGWQRAPK